MKYVIISLMILLSGCMTDGVYDTLKPVYKAGKATVKKIPLSEDIKDKLIKIDKAATMYDEARGVYIIEYEVGKLDANTSKVSER